MSSVEQKTVFLGLSGGVDSSVAAFLLKKQGYDVVGVFMRCYNLDGCSERDSEDARRVAEHLEIPFYVWDFEEEYKKKVVEYMVDGYRSGITPNPDVMCNKEIKFGLFLEKALDAGADFVATGHYVKMGVRGKQGAERAKKYYLSIAKDKNKDQSYFLWTLTQEQLRRCLFPIGDYLKPEVRAIAREAGLPTAEKKDSQGICFLGQVSIADFLKQYILEKPGALVTVDGLKIGEHSGAEFYTIGQRHGVGARGERQVARQNKKSDTLPLYVAGKDLKTNTVVVAEGSDNPALYRKEVKLTNVNFINQVYSNILKNTGIRNSAASHIRPPRRIFIEAGANKGRSEIRVMARVRYRQPLAEAVLVRGEGRAASSGAKFKLIFKTPQKFVASGQSAVFYNEKGEMFGGGVIV
jgi:tRNA-uridine 2-sulfurtransferase